MNPKKSQTSYTRLATYHDNRFKDPIRVQLSKKGNNPEAIPYHKYHYMHSDVKKYKFEPYVRSPLDKDQFLNKTQPTIHDPSQMIESKYSQSQVRCSPEKHLSKSYSNLKIRENYTYLEQILSDLAEKMELTGTRKYVNRIEGDLAVKCDKIISRMENGYLTHRRENEKYQESIVRMFSLCHPKEQVSTLSKEKLLKQLQKSVSVLIQQSQSNNQTKQQTKQLTQQIRGINNSLELQSHAIHSHFQQQKSKMKQYYEAIYLKIYEDSQRYKREMEQAQKQLKQYDKQQHTFTNKYEGVFMDISEQLTELKARCQELKEENSKEKRKRNQLKETLLMKELSITELKRELEQVRSELEEANAKTQHVKCELEKAHSTILQDGSQHQHSHQTIEQLSKEIETLKHEVDMQKMVNSLLIQKLQAHNRKNSKDTLLFQLSQKSLTMQDQAMERDRLKQEIEEDQHQLSYIREELATSLQHLNTANERLIELGKQKQKSEQELAAKEMFLKQLEQSIQQKKNELDQLRSSLVEEEDQLASISQQQQQKQTSLSQLQSTLQQTAQQITKLQLRKQETEQDINRLVLILVRLQSDQLMSQEGMGRVEWVKQWWQWVQQSAQFGLHL